VTDGHLDNPAARLHAIMTQFRSIEPQQAAQRGIGLALGIVELPQSDMLFEIASFIELAAKTKREITKLEEENHSLLLRWLKPFNDCIPLILNLQYTVGQVNDRFGDKEMYSLEICADLLHRRRPEVVIDDDHLIALIDLVREAIDAITTDDELPIEVRFQLIDRLKDVERALIFFRTTGYDDVESAMDSLSGTIIREPAAQKSKTPVTWWQKLWANIGLAATGTKAIAETTSTVMQAIESVSPSSQ